MQQAPDAIASDLDRLATDAAQDPTGPALGEIYEHLYDRTYRYLYVRVGSDQATAEDLASELWERITLNIGSFTSQHEGSFVGWVFTIARNLVSSHYRRRSRRREALTGDMLAYDRPASGATPAAHALRGEQAAALAEAVNKLPKGMRETIRARFFLGLSVAETAEVLGKSENAVKVCQHRAIRSLLPLWQEQRRNPRRVDGVSTYMTSESGW